MMDEYTLQKLKDEAVRQAKNEMAKQLMAAMVEVAPLESLLEIRQKIVEHGAEFERSVVEARQLMKDQLALIDGRIEALRKQNL